MRLCQNAELAAIIYASLLKQGCQMPYVQGQARSQVALFPETIEDCVPGEHVVRAIDAFVDSLDLVAMGFNRAQQQPTGRPPYDPGDMLRLYLYGYLHRIRSSRRLESECRKNIEVMWLLNRLAPDFKTIAEFRRLNADPFRLTSRQFIIFCRSAGLVSGELIAIDGSKFQAASSRTQAVVHSRVVQQLKHIDAAIASYLEQLDQSDRQGHDESFSGPNVLKAIDNLKDRRSRAVANREMLDRQKIKQAVPAEPEAQLMKASYGTHIVAYNVQTAVDERHALIVHHEVTSSANDFQQLLSVADAAKATLESETLDVVADGGYANATEIAECERRGITPFIPILRSKNNHGDGTLFDRSRFRYDESTDTYVCPSGAVLTRTSGKPQDQLVFYRTRDCGKCALRSRCTVGKQRLVSRHLEEGAIERTIARLRANPNMMQRRRSIVEHPFGNLKVHIFGDGRFLVRGRHRARGEMALAVTAYNLRRAVTILGAKGIADRLRLTRTAMG